MAKKKRKPPRLTYASIAGLIEVKNGQALVESGHCVLQSIEILDGLGAYAASTNDTDLMLKIANNFLDVSERLGDATDEAMAEMQISEGQADTAIAVGFCPNEVE